MKNPFSRFALVAAVALSLFTAAPFQSRASDVSVTAANVVPSSLATIIPGTFGETITAGKIVYQSNADQRFYLADCTIAAKCIVNGQSVVTGMAMNGGAAGQPGVVCTDDPDLTPGFTLSTSAPIYVLSVAGGICPSADLTTADYAIVLMVAKSTTKCVFRARGHASPGLVTAP